MNSDQKAGSMMRRGWSLVSASPSGPSRQWGKFLTSTPRPRARAAWMASRREGRASEGRGEGGGGVDGVAEVGQRLGVADDELLLVGLGHGPVDPELHLDEALEVG